MAAGQEKINIDRDRRWLEHMLGLDGSEKVTIQQATIDITWEDSKSARSLGKSLMEMALAYCYALERAQDQCPLVPKCWEEEQ